jgi:hypothetical protein
MSIPKSGIKSKDPAYYFNNLHSLNYFSTGLFCPILLNPKIRATIYPKEAMNTFSVFEDSEETYSLSIENFMMYLVYKIFKHSYETKDVITSYESYFFNTVVGFNKKHFMQSDINTTLIAKYWKLVLNLQLKLIDILAAPSVKTVEFNKQIYLPAKHIESEIYPFSYYVQTLVTVTNIDDTITLVNLLPTYTTNYNLYNMSVCYYYGNTLKTIYGFYLDLDSPSLVFKHTTYKKEYSDVYSKYVMNFNKPSIYNCSSCYFKNNCTDQMKLISNKPDICKTNRKRFTPFKGK